MTREEMEATLLIYGWFPGITRMSNYVWVKTEKELIDEAVGIDLAGRVFNAIGPFILGEQPHISDHAFHNLFHHIMARETAVI